MRELWSAERSQLLGGTNCAVLSEPLRDCFLVLLFAVQFRGPQTSEFARQKLQPSKSFDAETQARIAKSQEEQRIYWVEKQRIHREKQQEEAQQKSAEQHADVAEGFRLERVLDISWEKLRSNVVDYYYLRSNVVEKLRSNVEDKIIFSSRFVLFLSRAAPPPAKIIL